MAQVLSACLQTLKEEVRKRDVLNNEIDDHVFTLMVLCLARYLVDPKFKSQTGIEEEYGADLYDVIITDGQHKLKCLLHPKLNGMLQQAELEVGCQVMFHFNDFSVHYSEVDLDPEALLIIHNLQVTGKERWNINLDGITSCDADEENGHRPLVTSRGGYLPLWNNHDPRPEIEAPAVISTISEAELEAVNIISIDDLKHRWKAMRRPYPAVLCRILHRSRLRFYGTTRRAEKWPFQVHLTVADESAVCTVVFWNQLAVQLSNTLQEGGALLLRHFTVRKRFHLMSRPTIRNADVADVGIELNGNSRNPKCLICCVNDGGRFTSSLPAVKFAFFTRNLISSLPDEFICDIIGLVTFTGRMERQRINDDNFCQYRWLQLADPKSTQLFNVQLFSTSQPDVHHSIVPGEVLICTQMKLVHNLQHIVSSHQQRTVFLTTTEDSSVHILDNTNNAAFASDATVKEISQWSLSPAGRRAVRLTTAVGGYFAHPEPPQTLDEFKNAFVEKPSFQLTAGCQLQKEVSSLCCRERRRFIIQGSVLRIQYNCSQKKNAKTRASASAIESSGLLNDTHRHVKVIDADIWQALLTKPDTPLLGSALPPSEFYQRCFTKQDATGRIENDLDMPNSMYRNVNVSATALKDLSIRHPTSHLTVTLTDVNHSMLLYCHLPLPDAIPSDMTFMRLLSGARVGETMLRTMQRNSVDRILTSAVDCRNRHFLLIVDAFLCSHCVVELTLARGYALDHT